MQRFISFMTAGLVLILLSATELFAQPQQASNVVFSAITSSSVRVIFTPGNGDSRIIVFKEGSSSPNAPTNGTSYSGATANFTTSPEQTAVGSKVVFAGTQRAVIIGGLTPGTEYTVQVFERFNGGYIYNTNSGTNNPRTFTTLPATPASVGAGNHNETHTSFRANWTNPNSGSWDGFIVTVSTNNSFTAALNWYNEAETGGNELNVQDVNTTPTVDITPNTTYWYRVRTSSNGKVSNWANGPSSGVTTRPLDATLAVSADMVCEGDVYALTPTGPDPGNGATQHKFKVWDAPTGGNALNAYPLLTVNINAAVGTHTYYVETVNNFTNIASLNRTPFTLTVNAQGPTANAGADFAVCEAVPYTYTLTGNDPSPANGEWTQVSGPALAVFGDASMYNSSVELPSYGTYTFRWTISQDGCNTTFDDVDVTVSQVPPSVEINPVSDVCDALSTTVSGTSIPVGMTGEWTYTSADGGTLSFSPNANSAFVTIQASQADIYSLTWTISSACADSSASKDIIFDVAPTTADAGDDQDVCGLISVNLDGNNPTVGNGMWEVVSGPGNITFGAASSPTSSVSADLIGVYVLRWTISSPYGACTPSSDDVTISWGEPTTVADAGNVNIACGDQAVFLNGNTPTSGEGMWSIVSQPEGSNPTFDEPTLPNAYFQSDMYGSYTLRWTITDPNGICPPSTSDIVIGFDESPTPAYAGFDQNVCGLATTLAGNTPTVGTGTWTKITGPGNSTFTDPNLGSTSVTVNNYGTYSFEWKIESSCDVSTSSVYVTFWNDMTSPALSAGSDFSVCDINQAAQLNGTDPDNVYGITDPEAGIWTKFSGPGTVSFTDVYDYNTDVTFSVTGTYVLRWTVVNGPCSAFDDVTVNVSTTPSVSFGSIGGPYCSTDNTPIALTTGAPAGGVYSGAGVSGNTFTPSSVGSTGTYTLTYTYTNSEGCSDFATTTVVLTEPTPVTWTETYGPFCEDGAPVDIDDALPTGGTYSGNGVTGTSFDPSLAGPGTHTITYTKNDGGCISTGTKEIVVNALPTVTLTASSTSSCLVNTPITFTMTPDASGVLTGNGISGNSFIPTMAGVGVHTITYTYTDGVTGCENTDTEVITVFAAPTVTFGAIAPVCIDAAPFVLNTGDPSGGVYSGAGVSGNTFYPAVAGAGTHTLTYTYSDGGCEASATQTVVVNETPNVTWTQSLGSHCETSNIVIVLTDVDPVGGTFSGNGVSGDNFIPSAAGPGTHTLTYNYTDGNGCSNMAMNIVVVNETPDVTWATSFNPVCVDEAQFALTGGLPAGGTYSGDGVSGDMFNPTTAGAGTHTLTYTYTDGNGCVNFATNTIVVHSIVIADAGEDDSANPSEYDYILDANVASSGVGTWTLVTGPGTASFSPNANTYNAEVTVTEFGDYTFRWTIVNGSCTSYDDVVISFVPASGGEPYALEISIPTDKYLSGQDTPELEFTVTVVDEFGFPIVPNSTVNFTISAIDFPNYGFEGEQTITGSIAPPSNYVTVSAVVNSATDMGYEGATFQVNDDADVLNFGISNMLDIWPPMPEAAFYLNFTDRQSTSLTYEWINNSTGVVVVGRKGASSVPTTVLLNSAGSYTGGNSDFNTGTQILTNTYVQYVGSGSSNTSTGLTSGLRYAMKVFTYNGDPNTGFVTYNSQNSGSNNTYAITLKSAFDTQEFPLTGDGILSSTYVTPNPARDNISLTIDLATSANLRIALFTPEGKQVMIPVDGSIYNQGRHSFNIPLKGIAAGVYSVVITADNEVIVDNIVVMP